MAKMDLNYRADGFAFISLWAETKMTIHWKTRMMFPKHWATEELRGTVPLPLAWERTR